MAKRTNLKHFGLQSSAMKRPREVQPLPAIILGAMGAVVGGPVGALAGATIGAAGSQTPVALDESLRRICRDVGVEFVTVTRYSNGASLHVIEPATRDHYSLTAHVSSKGKSLEQFDDELYNSLGVQLLALWGSGE